MARTRDLSGRRESALVGALAAAVALAVAELLAGLSAAPSLVQAVGVAVIDLAPPMLKDFAVASFGTADKPALLIGVVLLSLLFGGAVGMRWLRDAPTLGVIAIALFGVLGLVAALRLPEAGAVQAVAAALAATTAGVVVWLWLSRRWHDAFTFRGSVTYPGGADAERRDFLRAAGAAGALAVVGGGLGRWLSAGVERVEAQRQAITLPAATRPAPPGADGLAVRGLTPLYVPNARFYRIDTALSVPRVNLDDWRLEIGGPMASETRSYSYDELLAMDLVEADVTLACVSNEVGGDLVGNARWLGVPLMDLLAPAVRRRGGLPPDLQVVGRAVDGFTAAFPFAALDDQRTALVAVGMNGEPLPARHGFPARLVVSGLYGYVSATKWLSSVELHGPDFEGYWVPRGWSKEAPVKTQSRIDVPRHRAEVAAGRVALAGVAWAPHHGVERVEVQVDAEEWREARLSESIGRDGWRQWVLDWDATPGRHRVQVRATDGRGRVQTERSAPPRPDGASGRHTIEVTVV